MKNNFLKIKIIEFIICIKVMVQNNVKTGCLNFMLTNLYICNFAHFFFKTLILNLTQNNIFSSIYAISDENNPSNKNIIYIMY